MRVENYIVYILTCADGTLYTGITTDVLRRVREHNSSSKGAIYTKARRPVSLVYSQRCATRSEALKREGKIKKLTRAQKLTLCDLYMRKTN
jgi:putative endonuclease